MPVFQVEFDIAKLKIGARDAITIMDGMSNSAGKVKNKLSEVGESGKKASDGIKKTGDSAKQTESSFSMLSKAVGVFTGLIAIDKIMSMGKALLDASISVDRLNKSYTSIAGSSELAKEQLDFIYNTSQKLGLEFVSTAESAKTFFSAAQGTSLEKDMDKIFTSISKAGTSLSLSTDQMQGIFLALGQMISKGKVQAEELRGQLGERLPGAFQLAAQAMGMTTAELDKFMADGKLTAEDLLPKLADALENKFGASAQSASNGVQQAINKMSTEWTLFKANILDSESVVDVINEITEALKQVREYANLRSVGETFSQGMKLVSEGKLDYDKFVKADFMNRQKMVDLILKSGDAYDKVEQQRMVAEQKRQRASELAAKAAADAESKGYAQIRESLKTTYESRLQNIKNEYNENVKFIDAQIDKRKQEGKDYADLIQTKSRLDKQYADEKKALEEKENKKRGKNKEESEAKKFAESSAQYESSLKKLRNEVSSLEDSLDPTLTKFERMRVQIEAERDAAIQNADVKAEETVRRKQATAAQAKETAELEKRKAKLTATQKLDELENQNLRDKADFYKDLAEKTGRYSTSMEYQNQLLEKQREIWLGMGIPVKDVQEMISQLQLESSRDPFDGITRGLQGFITEATDGAKAMESTFSDLFNGMDSGFHDVWEQMLEDGKVSLSSFKSLFASFLADLMHMAITRPITVQIAGVVSGMLGTGGVAYAAGGSGGGAGGLLGNVPLSNLSSFLPDSFTSGLSGIMGATLPGTVSALTTPGAYTAGEILLMQGGGTTAGTVGGQAALMSGGLSLGSALMYGGLGSLGYSVLGGALGLPQSKYSGLTAGLGGALGAWGGSALGSAAGIAAGATMGSVVPVVGTIIGALAGGALGSLFGQERKTHPSVYGHMMDQGYTTDAQTYIDAFMEQATYDRAGKTEASAYAQVIGEAASQTAGNILNLAAMLPDEYKKNVEDQLESATWSAGRGYSGASWNLQNWKEGMAEERIQEAIDDMFVQMGLGANQAFAEAGIGDLFTTFDLSTEEGFKKAQTAISAISSITTAIDEIKAPTSEAERQAEAFVTQMNALGDAVKASGLNAAYADKMIGEYRTAYVDSYVNSLEEMFNPLSQIEQQAKGYKEAIDGYVAALTTMGASEAQLAQVRGYTQTAIDNIISSLESSLSPLSEIEQARQNANASIDQHIAALRQLGASESEITRVESMRAEAVRQATEELLRSFSQGLEQRYATLNGTSDAVSRAISQENELREAIQKFGEGSAQVAELLHVQAAENVYAAQAKVDALQEQLNQLKAQAIQAEISAINEQLSAAKTLKETWERLSKSLYDSRAKLWTSDADALGLFARRDAAQSEFDRLYTLTMQGDEEAAAKLASSGDTLLSLLKETSENGEEYTAGFWNVEQKLKDAESVAGKQLSEAQKSYNALESQLKTQQSMLDALGLNNSSLDAINAQIVTVGQQLAEALGNLNIAQSNPNYGGTTSGGGFVSWQDKLLQEKADALNAGQTLAPGQTAGGWTPDKVLDAIEENGWTFPEWYEKFGKLEGFAAGGLTPRNTPFLVGEKGPELMMSPQQYGVLNNQSTRQLMMMPSVGTDGGATAIIAQLRENNAELKDQNRILKSLLLESQSTRKNTAQTADSVENMVRTGVRTRQQ